MFAELNEDGSRIVCDTEWRHKDLVKSIPGARWNKDLGRWMLPVTWSSCLALRAEFKHELTIGPCLAEWAKTYKAEVLEPAMELRSAFQAEGDPDLFPHQRADVMFLAGVRRALLASEMGVGKTASAIRTLAELTRRGERVFPCLIVAPNSTKQSWRREFARWWPGIQVTVISGTAAQRRKQFRQPSHVYVINYESMRAHSRLAPYGSISLTRCIECGGEDAKVTVAKCHTHLRELNQIDLQTVIVDECHKIKDPTIISTRAIKAAAGDAQFRIAMTGTPIANNVMDLWSILNFIDPTEWPSRTRWTDRVVDVVYNVFGGIVLAGIKPEHLTEFEQTVHPRMRRMTKEVVLPFLPPIVRERRDVPMTPKQAKAYQQMADTLMALLDDASLLVSTSPMTQTLRLLQLASSYGELETRTRKRLVEGDELAALMVSPPGSFTIAPDGKSAIYEEEYEKLILTPPSSKIDAFLEDWEDYEGRTVIVFAVSRQLIMMLSEALDKRKIEHGLIVGGQHEFERDNFIQDFQKGRTKIILATVGAGGTGITLTAADTMVYLQRSWSLIEMTQSEARGHRIGSEVHDSILRVDYVCPDTLEEAVIASLDGKYAGLEELVKDKELMAKALRGDVHV